MEYQERENELLEMFPDYMRFRWTNLAKKIENLREIRLRVNQPILIYDNNGEHYLTAEGIVTNKIQEAYKSRATEIEEIINHVCEYSLYAYENEFRQGYFTVQGGHRIGIGGKIITDSGKVKNMKHISYVNIRISHQVVGIANPLMRYLYDESGLKNILILSPPGYGKTTLLRDIVRLISNGNDISEGKTVSIIDERSEIAGSYYGIAQNNVGIRTDVLDGCPKVEGMMMAIRSLAPQLLAVDEIGGVEDLEALKQVLQCGCHVLATVHCNKIEEIHKKVLLKEILEQKVFQVFIEIHSRDYSHNYFRIYDEDFQYVKTY